MSINNVTLVGRLTKDPEIRYSQQGTAICNFTVAVNRNFKTQDGQDADFINCVVFRGGAESLANYQRKGNLIGVTGRLQSRTYQNQQDQTVFVTELVADSVQFLEPKKKQTGNTEQSTVNTYNQQWQGGQQTKDPFQSNAEPIDISDDDLPF